MNTNRRQFFATMSGMLGFGGALTLLDGKERILPLKTITYYSTENSQITIPEGTFQPNTTVIINFTSDPKRIARLIEQEIMKSLKSRRQLP